MFKRIMDFIERKIQPLAGKLGNNTYIKAITNGMLGIIPITVGVSFVSILTNLPIISWQKLLTNLHVLEPAQELIIATSSLLAIYIVISISYSIAKELSQDPKPTVLISTAVFIIMMPQSIEIGNEKINALLSSNLGSNGIFVAIIIGVIVSTFYDYLIRKNIKFKMPEQVPSNVSASMTPIIAAMIIFSIAFLFKYALSLTNYGDLFSLFYQYLTKPAMFLGKSGWSAIVFYYMLRSLFWFFGIHPSPTNAIYLPLQATVLASNIEAMAAGNPIPYIEFQIMAVLCTTGGTACTIGLAVCMLKSKSERYKSLNKVAIIPAIFNINEPYVFGVPLMLNPFMLIPMLLAPLFSGIMGILFVRTGIINSLNFNPSVSVAWVMPAPLSGFMQGGLALFFASILAIVVQTVIYYPFFKIIDKQAYKEEQAILNNI